RLTFNPGDTAKTFVVTNIDESIKEGDHTVKLKLFNASGGATLGLTNATLTIIDNDIVGGYVKFSSPDYITNENAGAALITVTRNGGGAGTLTVGFATTNGTALSGVNYLGVTNTLTWANNDISPRTIAIPLLDDGIVESNNMT